MLRPPAVATLACAVILAALTLVPSASAAATESAATRAEESLLFVQQTRGSELERVRRGVYRLRLRGVSPRVATFTDRPRRRAGQLGTRRFVKRWAGYGFAADPPNAALVLDRAPRSRDVAMLTLSHPRYDPRKRLLTYTARPLRGRVADSLSGFAKRRDRVRPRRLGAASLFIDDGSATVYQPVILQVSNAQPGQRISVGVTANGDQVAWGSGMPFVSWGGIQVTAESGVLPITELDVDADQIALMTTPGAGGETALSFTVRLYLVADEGIETFFLRSNSDPGVEVTAAIGNSVPQVVNQTQTLFSWNPI